MELLFVRNAASPMNQSDVIQGVTDPGLIEEGDEQARACGKTLAEFSRIVHAVYSSDLSRCTRTAELACPKHEIIEDERLREQDFGEATGESLSDFVADNPEYNITRQDAMTQEFPDGESTMDVCQRVLKAVRDIVADHDADDTVVIVSHQTPILCFLAFVHDDGLHEVVQNHRDIDHCEVLKFTYDGHEFSLDERRTPSLD